MPRPRHTPSASASTSVSPGSTFGRPGGGNVKQTEAPSSSSTREQIAEAHRLAVAQPCQDARRVHDAKFFRRRPAHRASFHAALLADAYRVCHAQLVPVSRRVFHAQPVRDAELIPNAQLVAVAIPNAHATADGEAKAD